MGKQVTLMTEAGEKIKGKTAVWQEYPRPQLKREKWLCLNGIWELDGKPVRVPFPPEAALAEYKGEVKEQMTYIKHFTWPQAKKSGQPEGGGDNRCASEAEMEPSQDRGGKRILLHFGAVDQVAEVYLNGVHLGGHEGGYFPFVFDITEVFQPDADNILEVKVTDTLDRDFPYGKQCKDRGGMWYTPTSGIWQSVWLEEVPDTYVKALKMTPDRSGVRISFRIAGITADEKDTKTDNTGALSGKISGAESVAEKEGNAVKISGGSKIEKKIEIMLHTGASHMAVTSADEIYIDFSGIVLPDGSVYEPKLWTPEEPYLYRMKITVGEDVLETYTALRTVSIEERKGISRVCLNGKPIFMHGVLDQGYYSDGICTPAEEAEYERDILRMKALGINMIRKHIKIEPECFYYYCDVHGMLVMQDMVSNGYYDYYRDTVFPTIGFTRKNDNGKKMSERQKRLFEEHMLETIALLHNHPGIIAYTIFNEGWGQFESDRLYLEAKEADPTRLYDSTSGWFTRKLNDFDSVHIYFGPRKPKPGKRPMFLSEFGGYSYAVPEHVFAEEAYGYGACKDEEALFKRIYDRYEQLVFPYVAAGLCGSVYTQVSDVEEEINGFYTYDRKVAKVSPENMKKISDRIQQELESAVLEKTGCSLT